MNLACPKCQSGLAGQLDSTDNGRTGVNSTGSRRLRLRHVALPRTPSELNQTDLRWIRLLRTVILRIQDIAV